MKVPTEERLFEYLRDILYAPEKASLDLDQLPKEWRKFGQGMQFLDQCVKEQKQFGQSLAKGELDVPPPKAENVLASPLVSVQAALKHMVWRMQRTADGDYTQKVDFLGDFEAAFNGMSELLEKHRKALIREKDIVLQQNKELEQIQELFLTMTANMDEWVVVMDAETHEEYFMSKGLQAIWDQEPELAKQMRQILRRHPIDAKKKRDDWEFQCESYETTNLEYYSVMSYSNTWKKTPAVVHIIEDITDKKYEEKEQKKLLYEDLLTKLYNRRYGMQVIKAWEEEKRRFCVTFVDIDGLKYCNDQFGHSEGDVYIKKVASKLKEVPDEKIVCRVGGDEFLIIKDNIREEEMENLVEEKRQELMASSEQDRYNMSFSYGVCEMQENDSRTVSELLSEADYKMYQYKFEHKTKGKIKQRESIYRWEP